MDTRRIIILAIALAVALLAWGAFKLYYKFSGNFKTISADDFENIILSDKEITILDVRTAEEFGSGHIANAINIDIFDSNFIDLAKETLPQGRKVAVYCRSGVRSHKAAKQLTNCGYEVINLDGGIKKWEKTGKPIVK